MLREDEGKERQREAKQTRMYSKESWQKLYKFAHFSVFLSSYSLYFFLIFILRIPKGDLRAICYYVR